MELPSALRHFTATLLLNRPWDVDVAAVAVTIVVRFPTIGRINPRWGREPEPPSIDIDGANITLRYIAKPVVLDEVTSSTLPSEQRHQGFPLPDHIAHVDISCGGSLPGVEGAKAYAAAVHFVATATCSVAPASAVFWRSGGVVSTPAAFAFGAETILRGGVPLANWISFKTVTAPEPDVPIFNKLLTHGLHPFIGRELDLSPQSMSADLRSLWLPSFVQHVLRGEIVEKYEVTEHRSNDSWGWAPRPTLRTFADDATNIHNYPVPAGRFTK